MDKLVCKIEHGVKLSQNKSILLVTHESTYKTYITPICVSLKLWYKTTKKIGTTVKLNSLAEIFFFLLACWVYFSCILTKSPLPHSCSLFLARWNLNWAQTHPINAHLLDWQRQRDMMEVHLVPIQRTRQLLRHQIHCGWTLSPKQNINHDS